MPSEYDAYRSRADENQRWANECKQKIGWKPQSADGYRRLHDEALAEICLNDAMARAHSGNGSAPRRELLELKKHNTGGINLGVFDKQLFHDTLDRLIDRHLSADGAANA